MVYLQATEALLAENWTPSITGRATDVPKPEFSIGGEVSQDRLSTTDHARIVDGGDQTIDPQGIGWTHERIEAQVTVEFRSADRRINGSMIKGRKRLFGDRPGMQAPDRYVGVSGEAKRIIDAHRKGFAEFDLVVASPIRDESAAEGQKVSRADIDIAFITEASTIDPST